MTPPAEDIPLDPSALIRLGTIVSVDLAAARVVVRYGNPDDPGGGATTPPVRWLHARAGNTRTWSPPSVGEEVVLLSPDGQFAAAVALTGLTNASHPPAGDSLTECVRFADGALLSYDPVAHALAAVLPAGATARIEAPGGLTIVGDVTITGTVTVSEDVQASGISLKNHHHTGVQPGGGNTGTPA